MARIFPGKKFFRANALAVDRQSILARNSLNREESEERRQTRRNLLVRAKRSKVRESIEGQQRSSGRRGDELVHAIVQVPRQGLPRLIMMPRGRGEDEGWDYIYLAELI